MSSSDYSIPQVYDFDNIQPNVCYEDSKKVTARVKKDFNHMQTNICYLTPQKVLKKGDNPVKTSSNRKCITALILFVIVLLLGVTSACTVFSLEILKLKSKVISLDRIPSLQQNVTATPQLNFSNRLSNIEDAILQLFASVDTLHNQVTSRINFSDASHQHLSETISARLVDQYNNLSNALDYLYSLMHVTSLPPSSPSGYLLGQVFQWLCSACVL